jgi:hypothetical protein
MLSLTQQPYSLVAYMLLPMFSSPDATLSPKQLQLPRYRALPFEFNQLSTIIAIHLLT